MRPDLKDMTPKQQAMTQTANTFFFTVKKLSRSMQSHPLTSQGLKRAVRAFSESHLCQGLLW